MSEETKTTTIKEFAAGLKVSTQAVDYAIKTGLIEAYRNGSRRWVIKLSGKTLDYKPVRREGKRK